MYGRDYGLDSTTKIFVFSWWVSAGQPSILGMLYSFYDISSGLYAAGKTTALYKLKLGEVVTTIPTIGE